MVIDENFGSTGWLSAKHFAIINNYDEPAQRDDNFVDMINVKINNRKISTNRLHRSDKKQSINTLAKQKAKRKYEISSNLHPLLKGFSK